MAAPTKRQGKAEAAEAGAPAEAVEFARFTVDYTGIKNTFAYQGGMGKDSGVFTRLFLSTDLPIYANGADPEIEVVLIARPKTQA